MENSNIIPEANNCPELEDIEKIIRVLLKDVQWQVREVNEVVVQKKRKVEAKFDDEEIVLFEFETDSSHMYFIKRKSTDEESGEPVTTEYTWAVGSHHTQIVSETRLRSDEGNVGNDGQPMLRTETRSDFSPTDFLQIDVLVYKVASDVSKKRQQENDKEFWKIVKFNAARDNTIRAIVMLTLFKTKTQAEHDVEIDYFDIAPILRQRFGLDSLEDAEEVFETSTNQITGRSTRGQA